MTTLASTLQILSLEMGVACNLGGAHTLCPNALGLARYDGLSRLRRLTDADMLGIISAFGAEGFQGFLNFSYYNEPTLETDRLLWLVAEGKQRAPLAKALLITNGTVLPKDVSGFTVFDWVGVTDYGGAHTPDPEILAELTRVVGAPRCAEAQLGVWVTPGKLDSRMVSRGVLRTDKPCLLPFKEFIVDAFGNAHLCCFDWRGACGMGNVLMEGLDAVLARRARAMLGLARTPMGPHAPRWCHKCYHSRFRILASVHLGARGAAKAWLHEHLSS
jgi:hypothetical protein